MTSIDAIALGQGSCRAFLVAATGVTRKSGRPSSMPA
jgi:hypothetical protein